MIKDYKVLEAIATLEDATNQNITSKVIDSKWHTICWKLSCPILK